jgi:hypothetical protein
MGGYTFGDLAETAIRSVSAQEHREAGLEGYGLSIRTDMTSDK